MTKIGEIGPGKQEPCALGMAKNYHAPWASFICLGHLENCTKCALGMLDASGAFEMPGAQA